LHEYERAQRVDGRRQCSDDGQGGGVVVEVTAGSDAAVGDDLDRPAGVVLEGEDRVLGVTAERADQAVGEGLAFEHSDSGQHGEVLVEPNLELITRDAKYEVFQAHWSASSKLSGSGCVG